MPPAEELFQENLALKAQVAGFEARVADLEGQLAWFRRQAFGQRSEKLVIDSPMQAKLGLPETPQAEPATRTVSYERRTPAPEKRPIPAEVFKDLPVAETIVILPEEVQVEPEAFERISEESTFEVDLIGPKLVKRVIVRPKFQRKADRNQAPVIAPALPRPAMGGYAAAGLLAFIAVSKYQHHLPLYRLEAMSAQWGAQLNRKSMADWIRLVAEWAEPIYKLMLRELIAHHYLQCDETPVKYLDPDEKGRGAIQGYLWVVSAPDGDVVFDWRLTRRHGELTTLLTDDYAGLLQSDGYDAYRSYVEDRPAVTWLGCWAHARRYFFEAQGDNRRIAQAALRLIARLYRREHKWDEQKLTAEQRGVERARPEGLARTMDSLKRLAVWARQRVRPKSPLGKACDYLLGQWAPLSAHLKHGQSRLDNNLVENAIRPSCIGKKNWLFIGHPEAGQRSAILYSLIVSCQRHGKDPLAYFKDVLARLPRLTNQDDLRQLTPRLWQPTAS